ncbi:peptide chain release factor N(5)-glutamine methyltransferase [Daejeonella sp. JGW-45]|uniref:peptide chain release factor N(5)-glutamine methyltransferase n=1 Tax=Daejeonella sp. JGW-45 TaxID=3034148 RepID=UPI0023ED2259|nr:peptide chain release factor N(5)-glutamine methyltransferase [Daejeonella sp. JGW-45]
MTIAGMEKTFIRELTALYSPEEAGSIARLVICFLCQIEHGQYFIRKNEELSEKQHLTLDDILNTLKKGVPVQYALGETEFYGLPFKVNLSVLIPRPETEELVDWILKDLKLRGDKVKSLKILDIGTGSGCIPVTLGKNLPEAEVSALDVSPGALTLAQENAILNKTEIIFIQDDILDPRPTSTRYSIITSNPPYITLTEKSQMHVNVLDHEPHLALFVPDDDPLVFYKAIANFAKSHLEAGGLLYLEINEHLGQETAALLRDEGFIHVELRQDLRDRDRMIKAQLG